MSTVKHLSYAGVALLLPTPELERDWLAAVHSPYDFEDADFWNFDSPIPLSIPTPSIPKPPDFSFNRLYWPSYGLSRPAWFHTVVTTARLTAIKSALGATNALAPLVMYDGRSGKTITAQMRMLPERPFNVTTSTLSGNTYWLLTLTDERFYYYLRRGVVTEPSSWSNLYSQLATILGVSVSVDTVDPDYLAPSDKWAGAYQPANVLLDAVAAQVGQRVVVGLDGTISVVNWETARTASGTLYASAPSPISGGQIPDAGIARYVPASVKTVFADVSSGGVVSDVPYVVENTLTGLAPPLYSGAGGVAGYFRTVFGDAAYDGTNSVDLDAYGTAAADDYYGWMLADVDVAYPGIEPWEPTGWEDRIEWTMRHDGDLPFSETTVRRGPFLEFLGGDFTAGESPLAPECLGSGSGSGSGNCTFSDDGWDDTCFPDAQDGQDPVVERDTLCIRGRLYVTRGRLQIVFCGGRLRNDWYQLATTREGCCECGTGSGSGSGDPGASACGSGSGSGGAGARCGCTGNEVTELVVVVTAPVGPGGISVELVGTVTLSDGAWGGEVTDAGGGFTTEVELVCVNGSWVLKVATINDSCDLMAFTVSLEETACDTLEGTQTLTGRSSSGTVTVSIDHPCPTCDSYDCVEDTCVPVVGGTYATLEDCEAVCGVVVGACCDTDSVATFTLAGITTVSPPPCDCTVFNTSWTAPHFSTVGTQETWRQEVGIASNCDGNATRVATLVCDSTDADVHLFVAMAADVRFEYRALREDWVCPGDNVMTLFSTDNVCGDLPATVTVHMS